MNRCHLAVMAFVALLPTSALAGVECDVEAFKTIISKNMHRKTWLALAHSINEETFNQLKKDISAGGEIPIGPVVIKSDMAYGQFSDQRRKYFERFEYSFSQDLSRSYVFSGLTQAGLEAYRDCMKGKAKDLTLFLLRGPGEDINNNLAVDMRWNPTRGTGTLIVRVEPDGVQNASPENYVLEEAKIRYSGTPGYLMHPLT